MFKKISGRDYLKIGTGNAWAWHVSANAARMWLRTANVTASNVNEGAFEPTGSIDIKESL